MCRTPYFLFCLFLRRGKAFHLFFNQFFIIEVVDLHRFLYICQCFGSGSSGYFASFLQHFVNSRNIFTEFFATVADRFQCFLHNSVQEAFYFYVAQSATLIVSFQFFQIRIIRQVTFEMFRTAESVQISKYGITLYLTRILYAEVSRIGVHTHDLLLDFFRFFGQIDAVSE